MNMNKISKRCLVFLMVFVMTFLLPADRISASNTLNATFGAGNTTAYIKALKVYSKAGGEVSDAEAWCASQPENKDSDSKNNWYVIPVNLNEEASGLLKKEVGVFICYQKTYDVNEAVRDVAMMNEGGNYSLGEYEQMIEDQKDLYTDLVVDMKDMIDEYRTNYKNEVPSAVQAHDFLNTYIEDDSGKKLGDLLLDISDTDLANIFLQANGQVVITIQEQLASACDTNKTTWLDRLSKVGSYEKLQKKFMTSYNINSKKAVAAMDQKYKEKAMIIYNNWEDIQMHFKALGDFAEENGLTDMSAEERVVWFEEKLLEDPDNAELNAYLMENMIIQTMGAYTYDDATIMNFFAMDASEFTGENIRKLYPLAASLTDGQFAAINETVSLFSILMAALNSTAVDDTGVGMAAEFEELNKEDSKELEDEKEEITEIVDNYAEAKPISVYEGVDRALFNGGVAVTSTAKDYKNSSGTNWSDSFVDSGLYAKSAIGMAAGSLAFTVGAVIAAHYAAKVGEPIIQRAFDYYHGLSHEILNVEYVDEIEQFNYFIKTYGFNKYEGTIVQYTKTSFNDFKYFVEYSDAFKGLPATEVQKYITAHKTLRSKLLDKGSALYAEEGFSTTYRLIRGLKIGLAIFAIFLAVADITMSVIALYKYYHRDHVDIPNFMVDLTYKKNGERSYTAYKSVPSTDGEQSDLNGGGGKQWLALYSTKEADAGDPILAPDGKLNNFKVQYNNSKIPVGYSPLHMFGEPNAAQNLTFADGEDGWSYNDGMDGIYLFFKRG
ncbi:MAG: hypothetical protein K6F77_05955 [Lachnospiraceae bacterium]|nr:hypothetical protein [Lachnospiraceae bacterium]